MSRASRDKGRRGEISASRALDEILKLPSERCYQYSKADTGPDLVVPDRHGEGFAVEVKVRQKLAIVPWFNQAVERATPAQIPVLMSRQDRGDWLMTFRITDIDRAVTIYRALEWVL
tara:strand:+ start:136 stop:486 length:351 start_codon:yes stop_codon:yes gene_type:complete